MDLMNLVVRARVLMEQSRYQDALLLWRDVCAFGEPHASYHVGTAICLVELGADDEARFELETALALDSSVREQIEDDVRLSGVLV